MVANISAGMELEPAHDCVCCGQNSVHLTFKKVTVKVKHDNKVHEVEVAAAPVMVCASCGDETVDDRYDAAVSRSLRTKLDLLQPEEIIALRNEFGLTQQQVADETSIAAETISRYENGRSIQSKVYDFALRGFFKSMTAAKRVQVSALVDRLSTDPIFAMAA